MHEDRRRAEGFGEDAGRNDGPTSQTRDTASASAVVAASPEALFDFMRRPANHPTLIGDGTVKGALAGPEVLGAGDRFGMRMRRGVPYRIRSRVVEFEEGRRIAWAHMGGHRWRWEFEPLEDGKTRITETFDMTSRRPVIVDPASHPRVDPQQGRTGPFHCGG